MMNKAYILENGIIELYLLGELGAQEELALERLLAKDDDLKVHFKSIESNFEAMALDNAIAPPKIVKAHVLNSIRSTNNVMPLPTAPPLKRYLGIVASIAAILIVGSIWMYSQLNETKQQLKIAKDTNDLLLKDIIDLQENLKSATTWLDVLNSPNTKQYILKGNTLSPSARVVSYVNHEYKKVIINTVDLPKLDEAHDYQMWADVDGEMIDMGVINKNSQLVAMNYIEDAASLNITIEPSGGSDHPTVSRLITNIYL
ncbi:anti-sigma-K factor rskA [Jejuia pallidilutea]|uniref:Anti-sigma-K factor rskA n=1 Tax=Jejuia pallidilutea TaxID=504487 RepID=A0A362X5L2_9FLAO|nr:anti-sigma factor [Jejuia pallidilutea]PQV47877.1 anti-sigma-K factor rskA [Jejuia pallidilutea]